MRMPLASSFVEKLVCVWVCVVRFALLAADPEVVAFRATYCCGVIFL